MRLNPLGTRTRARAITIFLVSGLFVVASQLLPTRAATTLVVNSLGDTSDAAPGNGTCADAGGLCTLRAAIQEGNALFGDDTINFSVTGTINLTSARPILSTNFNINGPGSGSLTVRRDSGGNYRVFQSSGVTSISGITITNGRTPDSVGGDTAPSGGGIWQTGGSLTLRDVVVTGNATGNGGTNATSGSSSGGWGGFGGGIYASGTLTMTDCVISNNTTGNGGTGGGSGGSGGRGAGIYFAPGILTLNNVTIGGPSGGNSGYGAGMWIGGDFFPSQNSTVNMSRVTITNNTNGDNITTGSAGGGAGIYIYQGTVTQPYGQR
jgi:CSLREA domain-containing protein